METFLTYLIPDLSDPLLDHAKESTIKASKLKAPFIESHYDKAIIHSWLAWQDPPGRQLHDAVKQRILDPASTQADGFVQWFKNLFDI